MEGLTVNPSPFPHVVADGLWDDRLLDLIVGEFPDPSTDWQRFDNDRELKLGGGTDLWGPVTQRMVARLGDVNFCRSLSVLFDIPDLTMQTVGGGYHLIPPGGKLGVHADFNRSGDLHRRLNLLIYLNRDWTDDDGGHLELWDADRCVERVLPVFNRTVIFATSSTSFHGHPVPLPGPRWRKSLAVYYFSPEPAPDYDHDHSTVFVC